MVVCNKIYIMSLDVEIIRKYHVSYDEGKTLEPKEEEIYSSNITHNLGEMADKAGIYEALWRPYRLKPDYKEFENYDDEYAYEQAQIIYCDDIIPIIEIGLAKLKANPKYYKKFDSDNGWGIYDHFVPFVEKYLEALKANPNLIVKTDR
jgi:hypothetical protein